MKLLTRLLIGIPVFIVVLIVAAGVILGVFIDPNDYRDRIEQAARDSAGIELKINGTIDWSVFPWLGLEVTDINMRYPEQPQLAQLERAQLSVKLLPLLGANVEMSGILVDGLELALVSNASGNNWSAAPADAASAAEIAEQSAGPGEDAAAPLRSFDIESFELRNAQIRYSDEVAGSRIEVRDLNLRTGRLVPESPIPLELSASVHQFQNDAEIATATPKLRADVLLDLRSQRYQLNGLDGSVTLTSASLGANALTLSLLANADLDLDDQILNLGLQKLALANLESSGQISVTGFQQPTIKGELRVADFNLKQLLQQLGQQAPITRDADALSRIGLSATLGGPANTLTLEPLALHIDGTDFNGRASLNLATMAQSVTLAGGRFDADRYLPPPAEGEQSSTGSAAGGSGQADTGWSKEEIIPVEPLQALNLDAILDLEQLQVAGLTLNRPGITVNAHNGLVKLSRINADLYAGTLRNSATVDARQTPLQLSANLNVAGVQIGDALTALSGDAPLTGALDAKAGVTARGQSLHAIINSLNGTASFNARDGVIKGIDMAQTVCQGINNVASLGINAEQVDQSTPFATIGGNFTIKDGVVSNRDLAAALDAMQLTGRGSVDLPQTALDYRLGLTITSNLFNETCSVNNRLEGVEFPVNCKGAFDTPPAQLCRPDASAFTNLLKAEAKRKVQEKVGSQIEEKLNEKLGSEGAKSLIKGLFGN
jgi:AsmA protein